MTAAENKTFPEPYNQFRLTVGDGHELNVEEFGNPHGMPVLFLHGGPGGGIAPKHRLLFDAKRFRAILFDQRGAGQSTPYASLTANTTWHLLEDIERIRQHLDIERWLLIGGSWGSTLGLLYAETHPERVLGMVLRGIFLGRDEEVRWFFQEGCNKLAPDHWVNFLEPIPESERDDLISAYYHRFMQGDEATQLDCAKAWATWEGVNCRLERHPNPEPPEAPYDFDPAIAVALAKLECHYSYNRFFLDKDSAILNRLDAIKHLPAILIHGRYDRVCPLQNAWDLHQGLPKSELIIVPEAGHSSSEPGVFEAQRQALLTLADKFSSP